MSKARSLNVALEPSDPALAEQLVSVLKGDHGAHGLRIIPLSSDEQPQLGVTVADYPEEEVLFRYAGLDGEPVAERSKKDDPSIRRALSNFAMQGLAIPLGEQSSRPDYSKLANYSGERPNLEADPSTWIIENPFIADLCSRSPHYSNLIRFLCNERGLFIKVGNYPNQRAYWNSTTNGGLPAFKKADPVHEGTFMLHDLYHFVPQDPLIGAELLDNSHRSAYIAHRLLSEASTLVMADMIGVADGRLDQQGYDVSKRKIFPLYQSMCKARKTPPDVDALLAANTYFCFTGEPEGFKMLGASDQAIKEFKSKYETIFRADFLWNLQNFEAMVAEREANPRVVEYYRWLQEHANFPKLTDYNGVIDQTTGGLDISSMLSLFRAEFKKALSYQEPLDDASRVRLAYQKYLAGQRIVFARFGEDLPAEDHIAIFDESYLRIASCDSIAEISTQARLANQATDEYISSLQAGGLLLPHEAALYRFSAPLYPITFVNYDKDNPLLVKKLSDTLQDFIAMNEQQLTKLLEAVVAI